MKYLLFVVAAVWFALGGLALWQRMPAARRALFTVGVLAILSVFFAEVVKTVAPRLHDPPVWDFRCFWVWGRIALTTRSVYDPTSSLAIGNAFPYDAEWRRLFLDVGLIYPPPTILLFAPLGLFSTPAAAAPFWYLFNVAAMLFATYICWHAFLYRYGAIALPVTAVLVVGFEAMLLTLYSGQPLPILLLLLALCAADRSRRRRGLWLGLAFIVKPLAAVLLLQPLLKRSWTELGCTMATIAAATLGAVALVGWQNVVPYFTNGPSRRYPMSIWLESGNQSLFSAVLRITHQPVPDSLLHATLFLACAIILTLGTVALCMRSTSEDRSVILSFLIALALLIFPPSGKTYNVILLIPIVTLLGRTANGRLHVPIIAYVSALYGFMVYASVMNGYVGILGPLSIWIIYAWLITREDAAQHARRPPDRATGDRNALNVPAEIRRTRQSHY